MNEEIFILRLSPQSTETLRIKQRSQENFLFFYYKMSLGQNSEDVENLTTEQLPDSWKTYIFRLKDLTKQLLTTEIQLFEENEIDGYLEIIYILMRENKTIPLNLWTLAMKGNEDSVSLVSPKFSLIKAENLAAPSPRTQLLTSLTEENPSLPSLPKENTFSLGKEEILDIIRDAITRKTLRMETLQNTINSLRERIQDHQRKGVKIRDRMVQLRTTLP